MSINSSKKTLMSCLLNYYVMPVEEVKFLQKIEACLNLATADEVEFSSSTEIWGREEDPYEGDEVRLIFCRHVNIYEAMDIIPLLSDDKSAFNIAYVNCSGHADTGSFQCEIAITAKLDGMPIIFTFFADN